MDGDIAQGSWIYYTWQIQIFCDNISSIMLTKNQFFHMRTKHIEVHYYYVCEKDSDDMFALGVHSRKT